VAFPDLSTPLSCFRGGVSQELIDTFPTQTYRPFTKSAPIASIVALQTHTVGAATTIDQLPTATLEGATGAATTRSEADTAALTAQESGPRLAAESQEASGGAGAGGGTRGPRRDGSGSSAGYGRAGSGGRRGSLGNALKRMGRALSRGQSDR
jgi:hypothetical protein